MRRFSGIRLFGLLLLGLWLTACTTTQGGAPYQGAGLGAAVGALSGALLDHHNPWRGAVIGGALGATLGGGLTAISSRTSTQAASTGQKVVYREGPTVIEATPLEYNQKTYCHKVRKRIWRNGRLITDRIEEVCESNKTGNYY